MHLHILFITLPKRIITMWQEMSNPAVLAKLGKRLKEIRIRQNLTQGELAEKAGISVLTVAKAEKGQSVSMLMFISIIRELGLLERLEVLVPETKISPMEMRRLQGKRRYRVRHIKNESHG